MRKSKSDRGFANDGGEIAFGGNFSHVISPDHVSHAAKNFAIVAEATGTVLYAGNANSYVRAIASFGGTTYVGGGLRRFFTRPSARKRRSNTRRWIPTIAQPTTVSVNPTRKKMTGHGTFPAPRRRA